MYEAGNNRVAQLLARTQHMDANIIKVFHSTQIQRDKRISWQLLLPYLGLGGKLFHFPISNANNFAFHSNRHNSILDNARTQRVWAYLCSAQKKYWKGNDLVRPRWPSRRTQTVHTAQLCFFIGRCMLRSTRMKSLPKKSLSVPVALKCL